MKNSHRFFENRECKYFPCHGGTGEFNCLFCYCPLYMEKNCPGNPGYLEKNGKKIKDCTNCTFPHRPENYDKVIFLLSRFISAGSEPGSCPQTFGECQKDKYPDS